MRTIRFPGLIALFIGLLCHLVPPVWAQEIKRPSQQHNSWFKGTPYELNVYRIYGRRPGKTMLIIGGIQGDEPGGFLSADLYVDMHLDRGDLIVIPRANFKSVILYQRAPDGDMNRQFHKRHNGTPQPTLTGAVQIIQDLMTEADVFLNLHDGRGFHRPVYIDALRNPKRFGQSIVIDTDAYTCSDRDKTLDLHTAAATVLKEINDRIDNADHHLSLFNTRTDTGKDYLASEMRKTATWYALTHHCLPAFGIESSKNIPSTELKVRYHNIAINAFMSYYGIVPEFPPLLLPPPSWSYLLVSINDQIKTVFPGKHILARPGDVISIKHIEANYQRGITCDLQGMGGLNDIGRDFVLTRPAKLVIRKDRRVMGNVDVLLSPDDTKASDTWILTLSINGKKMELADNTTVAVHHRDIIVLQRAVNRAEPRTRTKINFKGFVPRNTRVNTGDDRNEPIILDNSLLKQYSENGRGRRWPIVVTVKNRVVAQFLLEVHDR